LNYMRVPATPLLVIKAPSVAGWRRWHEERIDGEASGTRARAQQIRVAALLVREEALAVSEAEVAAVGSPKALAGWPPLEAQA
jgi:hypothetical protein